MPPVVTLTWEKRRVERLREAMWNHGEGMWEEKRTGAEMGVPDEDPTTPANRSSKAAARRLCFPLREWPVAAQHTRCSAWASTPGRGCCLCIARNAIAHAGLLPRGDKVGADL